ncbi:hypothetical protein T12_16790 [Trichinella patagoniensis]|uniref:Uncharacterized protein n=1 Tax=Trichinella patagoniensis TaxID=990121 RepID=A0A0V0ZMJ2_9BILA|nr:hypothetical protein T12_16790 [Trichinella patagoniensis]
MLLLTKTEIIPPQAMAHSTSSDFSLTHFQECYPNAIMKRVHFSSISSTVTSRNNVIYDEYSRPILLFRVILKSAAQSINKISKNEKASVMQ